MVIAAAQGDLDPDNKEPNSILVKQSEKASDRELHFFVEHRLPGRSAVSSRSLTVDIGSASVSDDLTLAEIRSAKLGSVGSSILALREPPLLSLDDALEVALEVPSIAAKLSGGCSELVSSGEGTSDQAYLGLRSWCPGASMGIEVAAAVNLRTGVVTNPKTGNPLESIEAQRVAQRILRRIAQRELQLRKSVDALCHLN